MKNFKNASHFPLSSSISIPMLKAWIQETFLIDQNILIKKLKDTSAQIDKVINH